MPPFAKSGTILFVIAAPKEVDSVLLTLTGTTAPVQPWTAIPIHPAIDLVFSGVGKTCAAAATARTLDPSRHCLVASIGIAGALPGSGLNLGDVVLASASVFADEGVESDSRFQTMADLGFGPLPDRSDMAIPGSREWLDHLAPLGTVGPIATVSTCSGSDRCAAQVRSRTNALAEAMEGAAAGVVAHRLNVPFLEVRAISNTTGARHAQRWDLARAVASLGVIARAIASAALPT